MWSKFECISMYLNTLKIRGWVLEVESASFLSPIMFPNLKVIDFLNSSFVQINESIDITLQVSEAIAATFCNLEWLALPTLFVLGQQFISGISTTLSRLTICRVVGGTNFSRLSLHTLNVTVNFNQRAVIFPSTLENLTIHMIRSNTLPTCYIPKFPSSLKRLKIDADESCLAQCFTNQSTILSKVNTFQLSCQTNATINKMLFANICSIVPNATILKISDTIRLDRNVEFSTLPRSLTKLSSAFMTNPAQWMHIPKTCKILKPNSQHWRAPQTIIGKKNAIHVSDLPNIVESIWFVALDRLLVCNSLPNRNWFGLTVLNAHIASIGPIFFESLPITLVKLHIDSEAFIPLNVASFAHLVKLRALKLNTMSPYKIENDVILFDVWLSYLPKHLVSLLIITRDEWPCNEDDFASCVWPLELQKTTIKNEEMSDALRGKCQGIHFGNQTTVPIRCVL